ncbi:aminoacyl-tRNA hydrolase [uncultured Mobiluncus sp.]|uniref:aminoacyl-tRNA hydrolase n=1 Tax=uncultured Mobiluncus sp. TaxID=293425 RepID=UPI00288BCF4E|nr:aminoacyl-tRNA hydrolase [uncultured Mobiluncus sp.]
MSPTHEPRLDPSRLVDKEGTWLVVGLGNPGEKYAGTRHNCGYMVTDRFVGQSGQAYRNQSLARAGVVARVATVRLGYGVDAPKIIVAHTGSFMNESGPGVKELLDYYRLGPERLLVVHDELDLEMGYAKLKVGGSDGGHNGLKSIQKTLGTKDFARLRIGIGRPVKMPGGGFDVINWVLGRIPKSQQGILDEVLDRAVQCVTDIAENGLAKAQARLHLGNPK